MNNLAKIQNNRESFSKIIIIPTVGKKHIVTDIDSNR
jgi:hypothetical protein